MRYPCNDPLRSDEGGDLAHDAAATGVVVRSRVAEVEGQPSELEEAADALVQSDGVLRHLVVFRIVAPGPLEEILLRDAGNGEHKAQHVEEAEAGRLHGLHEGVPGEARRDARVHAEEDAGEEREEHGEAALLVHLQPALLREALRLGGGLRGADGAEDAHRHDEVEVPEAPAVHQHRQRLALLPRLVGVKAHDGERQVRDLEAKVPAEVRAALRLRGAVPARGGGLRAVVRVLRGDDLPHEHLLVAPHPRLLRVLEDLELLSGVGAGPRQQHLIAARVRTEQWREIVDLVVDDHVGLRTRRGPGRAVVLRDLRPREERELLPRTGALQAREAGLLGGLRGLARRGLRLGGARLRRRDLLLRGAAEAAELRSELPDLLRLLVDLGLGAQFAHARLGAHVEGHPRGAGEATGDLVPHRGGVAAGPGQNGVALLRVLHKEVREVVDGAVQGDPAVVRLVVLRHLRQRDAAARRVRRHRDVRLLEQQRHLSSDLRGLGVVLGVVRHALLRLEPQDLRPQLLVHVPILQQLLDRLRRLRVPLRGETLHLLLDLDYPRLAEGVPEGVGHQVRVDAQAAEECLGAQVLLDFHALVDVVEYLRDILSRCVDNRRRAAGVAIHELREVVDLAFDGHPTIRGDAMPVHLRQRDVL
mmetsp:Transcript_15147/g.34907  ORF Transcript_15147/g.34907 Transcript_15147/m.34907 type:complete len:646 (-) Transcript_15147:256-2193(-)